MVAATSLASAEAQLSAPRLLCRNTGGTWENKDVSKWAKVRTAPTPSCSLLPSTTAATAASVSSPAAITSRMCAPQTALPPLIEGLSGGEITVSSASISGDASCLMVRGKLRPGFDLEVEIEWILLGEPPAESEPEPPVEAEPEPPTEMEPEQLPAVDSSAEAGAKGAGGGWNSGMDVMPMPSGAGADDTDDDDVSIDSDIDDVPAEKDDGSTRGKLTIAATDLDDDDDLVLSDVKVTKGTMEPCE